MGMTSIWHWIIVLIVVLLLFGAGKIPQLMGDMAKGVKAFKAGLKEGEGEEEKAAPAPQQVQAQAQTPPQPQATAPQSPASPENPPKA